MSATIFPVSRRTLVFVVLGALVVVAVGLTILRSDPPTAYSPAPALTDSAIYSTYDFGSDDVIDIGTQPLFLPTGNVSETMRRDRLLSETLGELGFGVRFHPFLKGADVNLFLEQGDLDVGFAGDNPALTACAKSGVVVVALVMRGSAAIVSDHKALVADLAGQRIGYAFGSNAHYALLEALSVVDLDENDVELIPLDVTDMPDALDSGEIDAFSAWEPTPTLSLIRFADHRVIQRSPVSGYLYFSASFARDNPEAVDEIVIAVIRAFQWMGAQPANLELASTWGYAAAERLESDIAHMSLDQYLDIVRDDVVVNNTDPAIPKRDLEDGGRLQLEFEFLQDLGKIPESITWGEAKACFDPTIMGRLRAEAATQIRDFRYEEGTG